MGCRHVGGEPCVHLADVVVRRHGAQPLEVHGETGALWDGSAQPPIVEELANGVLRIEGQQEVRVNFEMRELIVTGYVRPADISRQNEITYDKIAGARIAYGGRGQITDVQQPTYGQQAADIILPF